MRMAYLSALVAGVGFFVTSVVFLGVWPARVLDEQARAFGPSAALALTASEQRGRAVYAREGCAYCHTQQIRFTAADQARFGASTLAWEGRRDVPHMLGTRRIGPDLARAGGTRSSDWHLVHLFDPRSVVADSVMPAYRHLFNDAATAPTQEALDVVAYLESLGRARALAEAPDSETLNPHPSRPLRSGEVPVLPAQGDLAEGGRLYSRHCASCHGVAGRGDGPASSALRPAPAALSEHDYTLMRLAEALWHGVPGTSMPAWRDYSTSQLAALAAYVSALGRETPDSSTTIPTAQQLAAGERLYADNCAQCHGVTGAGDGWAAHQQTVRPTNFQQQRPSLGQATRVLETGVDGTMMAAWSDRLGADDITSVAHFVRSLYRSDR